MKEANPRCDFESAIQCQVGGLNAPSRTTGDRLPYSNASEVSLTPQFFDCVRRCSRGRVTMTRWGLAPSDDDNTGVRVGFAPRLPWIGSRSPCALPARLPSCSVSVGGLRRASVRRVGTGERPPVLLPRRLSRSPLSPAFVGPGELVEAQGSDGDTRGGSTETRFRCTCARREADSLVLFTHSPSRWSAVLYTRTGALLLPESLARAQRLPQLNRRLLLLSALHKDALYAQPMPTPPRRRCTIALVTAGRCQLLQLIILARSGSRIAQPVQLVARKRGAADAAASPDVSFRPSVWSRAPGALPARRRRRQKRPFSPPFDTQLQHLSKHLLS